MKFFTVYDAGTGAILRTGYCQDETFNLQPQTGEGVIEGKGDAATQRVDPDSREFVPLQ